MEVRAAMVDQGFGDLALRAPRLILMALGAFAMEAGAAHPGVGSELRDIATDDTASSECIGDPRTPLCALDTWKACFMWGEPSLCTKVGAPAARSEMVPPRLHRPPLRRMRL